MQTIAIKLLGVEVSYDVPANLTELVGLPGSSEELIYKLALKQVLYHGSYGGIRSKISELLEERGIGTRLSYFGKKLVTQSEKEVDGKKVKVWLLESGKELNDDQAETVTTETDAEFFKRICAEKGVEPTEFTTLVQDAANAVPFDVTRKERTSAEKKASKTHLKIATEIADNGALERVAAQLSLELGEDIDVSGDRDQAINALALAIGKNERREAEARKNKYMTMGA